MKQAALFGANIAPEIDFDRRKLDPPDILPSEFPDAVDDLRSLAEIFCRTFAYCKTEKAVESNLRGYVDTLAIYRQRGVPVAAAWGAFRETIISQKGRPIFKNEAKRSLNYLPNGRHVPKGPRIDSCGCPLPADTNMPRLRAGETAHFDGEEFIYGNDCDPKNA